MSNKDSEIRGIVARIADAATYFSEFAEEQRERVGPDPAALTDTYLATRRQLIAEFMALAQSALVDEPRALQHILDELGQNLRLNYGDLVPDRLLRVRGYSTTHRTLLEYLVRHPGEHVPVSLLRVLVGDQVHTERRLRELRDLGFDLRAMKTVGEDHYVLQAEPDTDLGSKIQLRNNIKNDRQLSQVEKTELIIRCGLAEI